MKKILIVDNDPILLESMSKAFEKGRHQVITAQDGLEALNILKAYTPEVIFIDLIMPGIDGKMLCRIIRSMPHLNDVYLVILSDISAEEKIDIAKLEANASIAKGPMDAVSKHIIEVLDHPESVSRRCLTGETLGAQQVYARGITKELLYEKKWFEAILEKMSEGIVEVNAEGKIAFANPVFLFMVNRPAEDLYGARFADFFTGNNYLRISNLTQTKSGDPEQIPPDTPFQLGERIVTLNVLPLAQKGAGSVIILRDITEQKAAQSALELSEFQYHEIFENVFDLIYYHDYEGNFIKANLAAIELTGYSPDELLKLNLKNMVLKKDKDEFDNYLKAISEGGRAKGIISLLTKHGDELVIEFKSTLISDSAGSKYIRGTARDITKQTKTENALTESKQYLRTLLDQAPVAIISLDVQGNVIDANPKAIKILGSPSLEATIGLNVLTLPTLTGTGLRAYFRKAIEKGEVQSFESWYTSRWKKRSYLEVRLVPLRNGRGEKIGVIQILEDATERQISKEALEKQHLQIQMQNTELKKFRQAVEQSPDSIVITNTDGRIEYVNPKFVEMTGYTRQEVLGKNPRTLKSGKHPEAFYRELWQTITSGREWYGEFYNKRKDGTGYWEQASIAPVINEEGGTTHFVAVKQDISKRKALEKRIQESLREKEVMLQEIHHRVKNNLQTVSSLLYLQSQNIRDEQMAQIFAEARNRIQSMVMIHDQLYVSEDLAQIDYSQYILKLTEKLFQTYAVNPAAIKLNMDVDDVMITVNKAIPCSLIINELVSNCLKHAFSGDRQAGEIRISLRRTDGTFSLRVSDNGRGLPEDIDLGNTNTLGLHLVKTLARQVDGNFEIESRDGAIFKISDIPLN